MDDEKYMNLAYKEAIKGYNKGEIPVGAVIVLDNQVVAKAHNLKDSAGIVTYHAEILAIQRANKKIKDWRLNNAIMYVTLEPCPMCASAIQQSRISKVIYGTSSNNIYNTNIVNYIFNNKYSNHNVNFIQSNIFNDKCSNILNNFFKKIR